MTCSGFLKDYLNQVPLDISNPMQISKCVYHIRHMYTCGATEPSVMYRVVQKSWCPFSHAINIPTPTKIEQFFRHRRPHGGRADRQISGNLRRKVHEVATEERRLRRRRQCEQQSIQKSLFSSQQPLMSPSMSIPPFPIQLQ